MDRSNRLDDELVLTPVPKPMLTEFGIHHRLESCGAYHSVATSEEHNCVVNDNRETSKSWFFDHDGPSPKMSSYLYVPPCRDTWWV